MSTLNTTKGKIGKISKNIIEKTNSSLPEKLRYQQQKNTNVVIKWFKDINNQDSSRFMLIQIKYFHPSITGETLNAAIGFAQMYTINSNDTYE